MKTAWYALRRTLPAWNIDVLLPELVEYCKTNSVDEAIIKVDAEEFSHGLPTPEWLEGYLPTLFKIRDELVKNGIVFSINPWVTHVHCDRGRDLTGMYPDLVTMVGHDGVRCKVCSCPLGERWQQISKDLWKLYASVEPGVIWIEDDIRLLNHDPIVYGCFCELHMAEFSKRMGREITREEMIAALLAPGVPDPLRAEWLDMNRELTNQTVAFFERTVHEVSPKTSMGLMCSMPTAHSLEGRNWEEFTSALAGDQKLYARPCMCCYQESGPRGLYESEHFFRMTTDCLPEGTVLQTEVENWPFTQYSKSNKFTSMQIALSFIFGADGVTMNLYDHVGTPMSMVPSIGDMLRENKTFFSAIKERCYGAKGQGIRLINARNGAAFVQTKPGADWHDVLPESQNWHDVLEPLGYSLTFGDSPVAAINGQGLRSFSDCEIRDLLSKGLILDMVAAQCLMDMGYGEYLGVAFKRTFYKNSIALSAEEFFNPDFGGKENLFTSFTLPSLGGDFLMAEIEPAAGASVVSRIVDPDKKPAYDFVTAYENSLGGRVVVFPMDLRTGFGGSFLGPVRRMQIVSLVNWISKGKTPLLVSGGVYPLPFRLEQPDCTIVGAFNLSLDDWPELVFELSESKGTPKSIEVLSSNGTWETADFDVSTCCDNKLTLRSNKGMKALDIVVLTLKW